MVVYLGHGFHRGQNQSAQARPIEKGPHRQAVSERPVEPVSAETRKERVLVGKMAAHRREVACLGEQANVETIAGERLDEWGARPMLDRGESQIASFI